MASFYLDVVTLVCLCVWPSAFGSNATTMDPMSAIRHLLPRVDTALDFSPINITVEGGKTAFLPCNFKTLATHQVSWFRRRDWHILTTGVLTYTQDDRFSVRHPQESDEWTLQLKFTQERDTGIYECQLSTGTGSTSQFVNLDVILPRAAIAGGPEFHVQMGSTIKLVCIIEQSRDIPEFIFWYRNDTMLNYDRLRGGITVTTTAEGQAKSILAIDNASVTDTGNYSCIAPNSQPAHTNVFVSQGDKMAAIQRRKSSSATQCKMSWRIFFLSFLSLAGKSLFYYQCDSLWRNRFVRKLEIRGC